MNKPVFVEHVPNEAIKAAMQRALANGKAYAVPVADGKEKVYFVTVPK